MPVRAVFDANVLISGLVFEGVPGRCLDLVEAGDVECVICATILRDVAEKLVTRFGHGESLLSDELAWLVQHSIIKEPSGELHGVSRDPDDDAVIECALAAEAAVVVTGDADLLVLRAYRSVKFVSPSEFLRIIADS